MSASRLCEHNRNSVRDGKTDPAIIRMCRLGGRSSFSPQNCLPNLYKVLGLCGVTDLISSLSDSSSQCVLPSTFLKFLSRRSDYAFRLRICGGSFSNIRNYWEQLFSSPRGRQLKERCPFLRGKSLSDLEYCVPIYLHEDAGPYSNTCRTNAISWCSAIGMCSETQTRYPFHSSIKKKGVGPDESVWRALFADLDLLEQDGDVWCDGHNITFYNAFGRGDCQQVLLEYGLPSYATSNEICPWCLCNNSSHPWTDCRPGANWKSVSDVSNATFMARVSGNHPITRNRRFSRDYIRLDFMHTLDCKGVTAIVVGSTIKLCMLKCNELGPNETERLRRINVLLAEHNSELSGKSTLNSVLKSNLKDDDGWYCLRGKS